MTKNSFPNLNCAIQAYYLIVISLVLCNSAEERKEKKMKKLLISSIVAAALVLSFVNVNTFAANVPSSKACVAGGTLTALRHALASVDGTTATSPEDLTATDDTEWVTVMKNYIKVPNDKGLSFDVAIQTGLITFTGVKSRHGNKETANASGRISVRVMLTDEDDIVHFASPSEGVDALGDKGVTYNYRFQELSATFQGLCIDETGTIIVDGGGNLDCDYEAVSLLLETLTANSFNFYYGATDSGVYKIEVQARAQADAEVFGVETQSSAEGEAFVGLGSMLVETVRLIHDAEYVEIQ